MSINNKNIGHKAYSSSIHCGGYISRFDYSSNKIALIVFKSFEISKYPAKFAVSILQRQKLVINKNSHQRKSRLLEFLGKFYAVVVCTVHIWTLNHILIDPRPTVTDGSDHYFYSWCLSVRTSVPTLVRPHLPKSHTTKQISSQNNDRFFRDRGVWPRRSLMTHMSWIAGLLPNS